MSLFCPIEKRTCARSKAIQKNKYVPILFFTDRGRCSLSNLKLVSKVNCLDQNSGQILNTVYVLGDTETLKDLQFLSLYNELKSKD